MKFSIASLALVLASAAPAVGELPMGALKIVDQPDSPVEIREHKRVNEGRSMSMCPDQVAHETTFLNRSPKKLVGVEFALVEFNLFNEFMRRSYGLDAPDQPIPSGPKLQTARWESAPGAHAYLIGVAYVSRVRFEDGQIWKADLTNVISELKKIDADFDPAVLKK